MATKNKTGMYIGIGLGVAVLGAVAYFMLRKKKPETMSQADVTSTLASEPSFSEDFKERLNGGVWGYKNKHGENLTEEYEAQMAKEAQTGLERLSKDMWLTQKVLWDMEQEGKFSKEMINKARKKFNLGNYRYKANINLDFCGR